jgi:predicted MarR family transcription regulator
VTSLLDKLADREQAVRTHADYVGVQLAQLTAQISELEAELADLATTRKVLLTLGIHEHDPQPRSLPDNPVYQHILTALADADRPVRAKDVCQVLDLGLESKNIEGMRCKLKRLVARGLIAENEPGLFALCSR